MRKMILALVLVLALAIPVFADSDVDIDNSPGAVGNKGTINAPITTFSPSATGGSIGAVTNTQGMLNNNTGTLLSPSASATGGAGGAGGSAMIASGAIRNTVETDIGIGNIGPFSLGNKTFSPSAEANQKQKQQQGQIQGQQQKMNNDQTIAPIQDTDILIEAPKQNLLGLPSQSVPELNFGNGKMTDATDKLPNFAIFGIKKLGSEMISAVLSVNANVKFKNLYKAILDDATVVANGGKKTLADVRYQVIRAEAQKSWITGGNIGGGGSGLASNGLGGGSGAGSLIPSFGGTKADDLFTIIFIKVVL